MQIEGKVWGETSLIFKNESTEVHRIFGRKGGFSSKHKHRAKHNQFFIESGELLVRIWRENGVVDETTLTGQQSVSIEPGVFHQFEVLEDFTVAYEIYWTAVDSDDIEREDQGGLRNEGIVRRQNSFPEVITEKQWVIDHPNSDDIPDEAVAEYENMRTKKQAEALDQTFPP